MSAPAAVPAAPPQSPPPAVERWTTVARWHVAVRVAWLVAELVPAMALHFAWRLVGAASPWPRRFLARAARAAGVRVRVAGVPLRRDVLFVANHVSWIDILAIGGTVDVRFIAQDRIRHWPVIGWLAALDATIFVSRTDRAGVAEQIDRVRAALAGRLPIAIFPEGTTTDGRHLLPFKPALFAALEPPRPALMIQPVVLDFDAAGSALAWIGVEEGAENALRVFRRRGTIDVTVHFLDAFDPGLLRDRKAIAGAARQRIAAALATLHGVPVA